MKHLTTLFLLFSIAIGSSAQNKTGQALIDSLRKTLPKLKSDTQKVSTLNKISYELRRFNPDTGLYFANLALNLAQKIGSKKGEAQAYRFAGINLYRLSDYPRALDSHQKAAALFEASVDKPGMAANLNNIGNIYLAQSDFPKALEYYKKALPINESIGNKQEQANNLNNIGNIYFNNADYPQALVYYQKILPVFQILGNKSSEALCLGNIGAVYERLGDFPQALSYFQKGLVLYERLGDKSGQADIFLKMAYIYYNLNDFLKAREFHQKALPIWENLGDKTEQAANLSGLGSVEKQLSNYAQSQKYHEKALEMYEQIGNESGQAVNLSNLGSLNISLKDNQKALSFLQKGLAIYEKLGDQNGQAIDFNEIGNIYASNQDYPQAIAYQTKALSIAQKIGSLSIESDALASLSSIYEKLGNYPQAYEAYKKHILLRNKFLGEESKKQFTRTEIQYEFDKKETEYKFQQRLTEEQLQKQVLLATQRSQELKLRSQQLDLSNQEKDLQRLAYLKEKAEKQEKIKELSLSEKEKQLQSAQLKTLNQESELQKTKIRARNIQRNISMLGLLLAVLASFFIYRNFSNQREANRVISLEKQKSDELLLNILPAEVADELKEKGSATAHLYDNVTVLFTDFVNFTQVAENLSPQELVGEIDRCFRVFDGIIGENGLEKIKTIGDAYLAVCGLPGADVQHATKTVLAAQSICAWINDPLNAAKFQVRIGIHTGSVVAGIVGVKKFAYDIWGDTVNTAARMEQNSEPGKINLSGTTYELVKNDFACTHRGKIEAKNKGAIDMYFLEMD
jgi:class 3 adenylate cyclase/tetratricopeptide (TPR) repeat protein